MTTEILEKLMNQALLIKDELAEDEARLKPKKELLEGLKVQIEKEFSKLGTKEHILPDGRYAKWVDRITAGKLDKKAIMQKLGVDSLREWQSPDKQSSFVQFFKAKKD